MTHADSLAPYRTALRSGFSWNMIDAFDRWNIDVSVTVETHGDGLLAVEAAIDELRMALEFAVDPAYGDPVRA